MTASSRGGGGGAEGAGKAAKGARSMSIAASASSFSSSRVSTLPVRDFLSSSSSRGGAIGAPPRARPQPVQHTQVHTQPQPQAQSQHETVRGHRRSQDDSRSPQPPAASTASTSAPASAFAPTPRPPALFSFRFAPPIAAAPMRGLRSRFGSTSGFFGKSRRPSTLISASRYALHQRSQLMLRLRRIASHAFQQPRHTSTSPSSASPTPSSDSEADDDDDDGDDDDGDRDHDADADAYDAAPATTASTALASSDQPIAFFRIPYAPTFLDAHINSSPFASDTKVPTAAHAAASLHRNGSSASSTSPSSSPSRARVSSQHQHDQRGDRSKRVCLDANGATTSRSPSSSPPAASRHASASHSRSHSRSHSNAPTQSSSSSSTSTSTSSTTTTSTSTKSSASSRRPSSTTMPLARESFVDSLTSDMSGLHVSSTTSRITRDNLDLVTRRIREKDERAQQVDPRVLAALVRDATLEATRLAAIDAALAARKRAPLSPADLRQAQDLIARSPPNALIVDAYSVELFGRHLTCLKGLAWLNDEVINMYLALLGARSQDRCTTPIHELPASRRLKCHFFNSFFFTKLSGGAHQQQYSYKGVSRWTRTINLFSFDRVFMPVHVHGNHWCLGMINFTARRFEYFDSLAGANAFWFRCMRQYLCDEHQARFHAPIDLSEWQDVTRKDIPLQNNGSDCGVFTLKFADYLSDGQPIDFTCKDMPYFRLRIALEIRNQRIL